MQTDDWIAPTDDGRNWCHQHQSWGVGPNWLRRCAATAPPIPTSLLSYRACGRSVSGHWTAWFWVPAWKL